MDIFRKETSVKLVKILVQESSQSKVRFPRSKPPPVKMGGGSGEENGTPQA